jgi:HD superfamily phosphohydrolase
LIKHVLDPLYGRVAIPDYAWAVSRAPEVQRLREVRMCNINSLSITGAGAVHRFEHSLGTVHLALTNARAGRSELVGNEERILILAALLHDVGSAGFGHSVEYVLNQDGFSHDDLLKFSALRAADVGYEYKIADLEPVFFGQERELELMLSKKDLKQVSELVSGRGRLGPLISGSIDLDNIDNVYRLAYHVGIWRGGDEPEELAEAIYVDDTGLCVEATRVHLLEEWRKVRSVLYEWLLLDEDEFSAKAMLETALRSAHDDSVRAFRWHDVDYSLMLKLSEATPLASELAHRIMTGQLYGCLGVFETTGGSIATPAWSDRDEVVEGLEKDLRSLGPRPLAKVNLAVHYIQDVNKTDREIEVRTSDDSKVHYGSSINRTLVGVFATNQSLMAEGADLLRLRDIGLEDLIAGRLEERLKGTFRAVRRNNGPRERLSFFD